MREKYANNLKNYRVWKRLKQSELAELIGISTSEIRAIESNKVFPHKKTVVKICEYFNVSFEQMFYEGE